MRSGSRPRDRRQLPERLFGRVVHRVDQRDEPDLAHALEVPQDPLAVHRHALEACVEASATSPRSFVARSISSNACAPSRGSTIPHAAGKRSRRRVAVRGDLVVDPARVGDAVRAEVAVSRDHERLVDAAVVHDRAAGRRARSAPTSSGIRRSVVERAAERVERAPHVMVHVEDVEAERSDRTVAEVERCHGASSGQSRSAVPPSTSARSCSDKLRHARSGERDQVGVGAVVGLRVVGTPHQPVGAELADEPVDDLARVALLLRRFEHVRRDLAGAGWRAPRARARAARGTARPPSRSTKPQWSSTTGCSGNCSRHALQARQVLGQARHHDAEAELGADLPHLEGRPDDRARWAGGARARRSRTGGRR